jgi:hypothetical protein
MEIDKQYLQKFKEQKRKQTKESVLADEIYEYFGKKIAYPIIRKFIKDKGYQATYWNWKESCRAEGYNKAGLFIKLMVKEKVILREVVDNLKAS